ncbi:MAG: DUF4412 domain-containing protein [Bacteroidetes bacterium]|nr:DUF4412 domain-containing protein [Bacteroidota bacterium]
MKKLSLLFFLFIASAIAFSFTRSTSDFEGKVVYSIDFVNSSMPAQAKSMMAGSTATIYIKGTKSRSDMNMGPQTTTSIYDSKTNTSVMLMEVMGSKYKIKTEPTKKEEKKPEVKVNVTSETKTIAGYSCKKAEVTVTDSKGTSHATNIWFTEEISNHMNSSNENGAQFKDIKGMPLEYEVQAQNGMSMKMTATSVSKETVADSKFEIPSDYKETTMEGMQKEMMQKMQGGQH